MSDVTRLLTAIEEGDPKAAEQLLPLIYDELRRLAAQKMAQETPGQTLQATALVHDAYLRLVGVKKAGQWDSRGHFFTAAAEAMRRILVENARRKRRLRHGGGHKRLGADAMEGVADDGGDDKILAVDEALGKLGAEEPAVAEVVKLRYFAGFTIDQAAQMLGISVRTANRHWAYARAWLHQQLDQD
jgi:RNA polymerase sigma factor (TIGR02999 family)